VSRQEAAAVDVVGGIYEAALEPAKWPRALSRVASHLDATSAAAIVIDIEQDEVGFASVAGMDPRALQDYTDYYVGVDPWNVYLGAHDSGRPYVSQAVMEDRAFEHTEFCRDFLRQHDIFHAMGGFAVRGPSPCGFGPASGLVFLVGVQRPKQRGAFGTDDLRRMSQLFPHLERAARIHRRLMQVGGLRDGLTAALDRMPLAAILCDRLGRIVWLNRPAEEMVGHGDGLRVRDGRLEAAAGNGVSAELRRLIAGAAADGLHAPCAARSDAEIEEAGGLLHLPRPWPARPLAAMVTPLSVPVSPIDIALDATRPAALLLINDPDRAVQFPTDRLARTFGLTGAEAKLCAALATGTTLSAYAEAAEITIGTARWYLKQALAKTGAHRQSDLVRHVLTAVGPMTVGA
jgi:DNA-binding CsgD family transcriptional regulator/PAS domain-containing protein